MLGEGGWNGINESLQSSNKKCNFLLFMILAEKLHRSLEGVRLRADIEFYWTEWSCGEIISPYESSLYGYKGNLD